MSFVSFVSDFSGTTGVMAARDAAASLLSSQNLGSAQALYLMQRGPVIKDGDTLGNTSSERITVHLEGETDRLQLEGVSQWV